MYAQLRIFPITGFGTDGKPTITTAFPLLATAASEQEINNISCNLTPKVVERTYQADNREEKNEVKKGYDGTLEFYGIDADALNAITVNEKDTAGRTVLESNGNGAPKCVVFYHGKTEKGKKYNIWLYNVEFADAAINSAQEAESPAATSLSFFASSIIYSSHTVFGLIVYEGQTGYVAEGTEPTAAGMVMPTFSS